MYNAKPSKKGKTVVAILTSNFEAKSTDGYISFLNLYLITWHQIHKAKIKRTTKTRKIHNQSGKFSCATVKKEKTNKKIQEEFLFLLKW